MVKAKTFHDIVIFSDGACSGNPGAGGWGAIVATPDGRVWELGDRNPLTTNNQMELTATIEALRSVADREEVISLYTDSLYVIHGITKWIWGWQKRGWKTAEGKDVLNRDLWSELSAIVANRKKHGPIEWKFARGHSGIPGNERADEIAVAFAQSLHPKLYRGSLLQYGVAIHDTPENTEPPKMKPKGQAKAKAYSYVSLVGGIPFRHSTWAECERRVRGQSGAKFKKAMSVDEESTILRSWGIDPATV